MRAFSRLTKKARSVLVSGNRSPAGPASIRPRPSTRQRGNVSVSARRQRIRLRSTASHSAMFACNGTQAWAPASSAAMRAVGNLRGLPHDCATRCGPTQFGNELRQIVARAAQHDDVGRFAAQPCQQAVWGPAQADLPLKLTQGVHKLVARHSTKLHDEDVTSFLHVLPLRTYHLSNIYIYQSAYSASFNRRVKTFQTD